MTIKKTVTDIKSSDPKQSYEFYADFLGFEITFALADAFLKAGNHVVICGRHMDKLNEAIACLPGVKRQWLIVR